MKKEEIKKLLSSTYSEPLEIRRAWQSYSSFISLFNECDWDSDLSDYLMTIVDFNRRQRLEFRTKLAEKGYELTPSQLDQYILLLMIAFKEYIDSN